jgi:hypothetical protein
MGERAARDIVRDVCGALGLPRPGSLIGSNDANIVRMLELLHEEGSELAARYDWQVFVWECTFTTVANEDQGLIQAMINSQGQTFKHIVQDTFWDRTRAVPVKGPLSPQQWQQMKAGSFVSPYTQFRLARNHLFLSPAPEAGHAMAFEFKTREWLTDKDGVTYGQRVTADDDVPIMDTDLIEAGLKWRWLRSQGLAYQELFNAYEAKVLADISKDGGTKDKNLSGGDDSLGGIRSGIGLRIG